MSEPSAKGTGKRIESADGGGGTEDSLHFLVERSPVGMVIVNRVGEIEYVNPALTRIFGEHLARARNVVEFVKGANLDPVAEERALDYWRRQVWTGGSRDAGSTSYVGRVETPDGTREVIFGSLVVGEKAVAVLGEPGDWLGTYGLELANQAVREFETKYRRLHESMMDAIVTVAMDGRIIECNQLYERLLGYTAEELPHLTYIDLTPEPWHAMEARIVEEEILPRGYSEVYEKEYRRKDGTVIPVELRTILLRNSDGNPAAMWAIVRDITARRRLERELRESNELLERRVEERTVELRNSETRFRQLAEATFEGIAVSENGIAVDGNAQFASMLGWEPSEMVGRPALDFVAPMFRDLVTRHLREGYEGAYQFELLRKDGSAFPCEARGRMADWQGRKMRVTVFRDLTEPKRIEAELAAQREALAHARRTAIRSEISAGVVHQIGQPLTAVGNNLTALKSMVTSAGLGNPEVDELLTETVDELKRIRTTMSQLHSLAHPDQQRRTQADLNALLEETLRLVSAGGDCEGVRVDLDLQPDLPGVSIDTVQMIQVFGNLFQNACDAMRSRPSGSPTLTIVTLTCDPAGVEVFVRDTGPGLSPEVEAHLFEPFVTTKAKGVGIGLPLARRIVEAHGGTIEAVNNDARPGGAFRVWLPIGEGTS